MGMAAPSPGHARLFLGFHPLEQPLQPNISLGAPFVCTHEYQDQSLGDLLVDQLLVIHGAIQPVGFLDCRRIQ